MQWWLLYSFSILLFTITWQLSRFSLFVVIVKYWTAGLTMHATDIYYTLLCPQGEIISSKYQTVFRNIFSSPSPWYIFQVQRLIYKLFRVHFSFKISVSSADWRRGIRNISYSTKIWGASVEVLHSRGEIDRWEEISLHWHIPLIYTDKEYLTLAH